MKYIVQQGDSPWSIAQKLLGNGLRYKEILKDNNLSENSIIYPGQQLIISTNEESNSLYTVKPSDNLSKNKKIYNKHKTKCCVCGEDAKCCLEFHHIKEKNFNISKSLKHITSLQLLDELKLTVCICKNCHSKLHNNLIKL